MSESFLDGKVTLHRGDCLEVMATLEPDSVDSVVCDPPYHLTSIVKRFGQANSAPVKVDRFCGHDGADKGVSPYARSSRGFMGKQWDGGGIAFDPATWALVLRVLKPGGHLLAFSGTRTYHRMACAIEDAGFEIRDQIGWCYGSGFPKSHDLAKAINKANGVEFEALPASGVGFMGPDGPGGYNVTKHQLKQRGDSVEAAIQWQGWGTALKPAWEPICLARKPISESSIAANVLKHGTGGINVNGCRVEAADQDALTASREQFASSDIHTKSNIGGRFLASKEIKPNMTPGRWPANLIHDGSEEVLAGFPESGPGPGNVHSAKENGGGVFGGGRMGVENIFKDSGSAARFFYTAKADTDDRLGSKHPTVKPLDLMQYLVRLITPKGGVVLDPFAGTGTTGEAAWREGLRAVLVEREPEYQADIVKRMGLCLASPDARRAASVPQLPPHGLFEGLA